MAVTDRNSPGRQYTAIEVARMVRDAPVGGGSEWRHVDTVATILAESDGYEWVRPMVLTPGPYYGSIDRGICQFNSARRDDGLPLSYWASIPDHVAFDAPAAIRVMVRWLHEQSLLGTRGSKPWAWGKLLDWQWSAFNTAGRYRRMSEAIAAVETIKEA